MLADLAYLHSCYARLVVWILLYYCENLHCILESAVLMVSNDGTDKIDKVCQSNYHSDPSAVLLEVLDLEQSMCLQRMFLHTLALALFF